MYDERRLILTALGHTPSPGGMGTGCPLEGSAASFLQQLQAGMAGGGGGGGRPLVGGDAREGIEVGGLCCLLWG